MQSPLIHLNYLAVLAAVVVNFLIGGLWYGPLFGKAWAKEAGFAPDFKPPRSKAARGMIMMVIGSFLIVFVLAHSEEIWRPSVWKVGPDQNPAIYGFFSGFFTWIGFFVPLLLNQVAWELRSWKFFGINAAFHFISLQ